jgi:hypothetical protein
LANNMFQNFWDNINSNPVVLAGIAQVIVPLLVVFDIIHWTEAQTAMVYTAITAITTLMVRGNTVAVNKVEQRVEEKVAHREMAGTTGTGAGMTPTATPGPASPGIPPSGTGVLLIVALVGGLLLSACGPKLPPQTSVEANVAVRGTQVVTALRATIPSIKSFVCQPSVPAPCLQPVHAERIFKGLESAGEAGEQLATVLAAVDSAKTAAEKTSGMERARTILTNLQSTLVQLSIVPDDSAVRSRLVQTFSTVMQLLLAVSTF